MDGSRVTLSGDAASEADPFMSVCLSISIHVPPSIHVFLSVDVYSPFLGESEENFEIRNLKNVQNRLSGVFCDLWQHSTSKYHPSQVIKATKSAKHSHRPIAFGGGGGSRLRLLWVMGAKQ